MLHEWKTEMLIRSSWENPKENLDIRGKILKLILKEQGVD
jgi:hypothetical protein